jgi:hypothetical protein
MVTSIRVRSLADRYAAGAVPPTTAERAASGRSTFAGTVLCLRPIDPRSTDG